MSYESRKRCERMLIRTCVNCPLMFKCPYDVGDDDCEYMHESDLM